MAILVVPDEVQTVVEAEVREGGYADAGGYLTQLIREMDLEALVLEGMESGDPIEMTPDK